MNWKFMAAATFGLLAGLSVAPFAHRTVAAAPASAAPANARFQMQDAMVVASTGNGEEQDVLTHVVFMLDAESGRVWKYQGVVWHRDKDGSTQVVQNEAFFPVDVVPPKAQ